MAIEKKHITLISLAVIAVVGASVLFAPPHIKDKVARVVYASQPERQCYAEYESSLKDPDSAYLVDSRVLKRSELPEDSVKGGIYPVLLEYPEAMEITIAAKNSFGAYSRDKFQCPIIDGEINSTYTLIWKLKNS